MLLPQPLITIFSKTRHADLLNQSSVRHGVQNGFQKVGSILGVSLLITACQPASNQTSNPATTQTSSQTPSQTPSQQNLPVQSANSANPEANQIPAESQNHLPKANVSNSDDIAKRLEISYARNASYKKDECPKLVEFESINQTVTRQGEQLPSDFCEYYVFLNQGDTLNIHTSDDMHAKLIAPSWFDFRNGSYTAPKFDKYTVRLSYDGVRYHPANFRYDVTLVKSGVKPN